MLYNYLHKPSLNSGTLILLSSFSILIVFDTLLYLVQTPAFYLFDPIVRRRRCINASASYACIHHTCPRHSPTAALTAVCFHPTHHISLAI